jgi:hypothetical protein
MAINAVSLDVISKLAGSKPGPCRMLSFGYPDMLVTDDHLRFSCGPEVPGAITYREDSEAILRWHGLHEQLARVPETRSLLSAMGIECDFIDISPSRGFEKVVDLNFPGPAELAGQYDIVFDGGTLEHCFNVGQVMRNAFAFAKVGGFIVHVNPLNCFNHGFFNFNPTFYYDWYARNGHPLVYPLYAMYGPLLDPRVAVLDHYKPFKGVADQTALVIAAQKRSAAEPSWPMQGKYRENPGLKK